MRKQPGAVTAALVVVRAALALCVAMLVVDVYSHAQVALWGGDVSLAHHVLAIAVWCCMAPFLLWSLMIVRAKPLDSESE